MLYICYAKIKQVNKNNQAEAFIFYREKNTTRERFFGRKNRKQRRGQKKSEGIPKKSSRDPCELQHNLEFNFQNDDSSGVNPEPKLSQRRERVWSKGRRQAPKKKSKKQGKSESEEIGVIDLDEFEKRASPQRRKQKRSLFVDDDDDYGIVPNVNENREKPASKKRKNSRNRPNIRKLFGGRDRTLKDKTSRRKTKGETSTSSGQDQFFVLNDDHSPVKRAKKRKHKGRSIFYM